MNDNLIPFPDGDPEDDTEGDEQYDEPAPKRKRGRPKGTRNGGCRLCDTIPPDELVMLDVLLADPLRWPKSVWGIFPQPKGHLPASYRRWGALKLGMTWLRENGHADIGKIALLQHYREDVPTLAVTIDDLVTSGLIASTPPQNREMKPIDPLAFMHYYQRGIDVGIKALDLIEQRVDYLIAHGQPVPPDLLKLLVEAGMKLSTSQAALRKQGTFAEGEDPDAFRVAGGEASPRIGSHRIREIDGESRPVKDRGPKDRAAYNETARQSGSPLLPERA